MGVSHIVTCHPVRGAAWSVSAQCRSADTGPPEVLVAVGFLSSGRSRVYTAKIRDERIFAV
jgi:hypothetical protein